MPGTTAAAFLVICLKTNPAALTESMIIVLEIRGLNPRAKEVKDPIIMAITSTFSL